MPFFTKLSYGIKKGKKEVEVEVYICRKPCTLLYTVKYIVLQQNNSNKLIIKPII